MRIFWFKPEKMQRVKPLHFFSLKKFKGKAGIYTSLGKIVYDSNFLSNLNEVQMNFTILHEIGHHFYFTETKADLFSCNLMLICDYKPLEIYKAVLSTLDKKTSEKRIKNIKRYLIWTQKK